MHIHEVGADAIRRLESDLRTFSRAGIERVAWAGVNTKASPSASTRPNARHCMRSNVWIAGKTGRRFGPR